DDQNLLHADRLCRDPDLVLPGAAVDRVRACAAVPTGGDDLFLGGMVGAGSWLFRPQAIRSLRQPWPVWALGVAGLCIYHCAYFFAIQSAPPVEASLIAYLWPLLIVVFAAFLPGERLRAHHLVGVLLGLAGAVIVITKGGSVGLADGIRTGHVIALFCAFVWS